ncbi:MAG TPA: hypothetical protein VNG69_16775 [Casimicrobiaceae bacterium]|nr:hypothetical protein [Casimicrobiaceae bacterium]
MISGMKLYRAALLAALPMLLASCATDDRVASGAAQISEASAPQYRVGDRWVYRVREGFRTPIVFEETHTVTSIASDGITVHVTMRGPTINEERIEKLVSPGLVRQGALFDIETRRFAGVLERYRFPLRAGSAWQQRIANHNELTGRDGVIDRHVRVAGFDRVTTPAGTFDAVRLTIIMRLDDEEFWRWPTDGTYTLWYVPEVKASVREVKRASYVERSNDDVGRLPAQNTLIELLSFTPGR